MNLIVKGVESYVWRIFCAFVGGRRVLLQVQLSEHGYLAASTVNDWKIRFTLLC